MPATRSSAKTTTKDDRPILKTVNAPSKKKRGSKPKNNIPIPVLLTAPVPAVEKRKRGRPKKAKVGVQESTQDPTLANPEPLTTVLTAISSTSTPPSKATAQPIRSPSPVAVPSVPIPALLTVTPAPGPTPNIVAVLEKAATKSGTRKKKLTATEEEPTLNPTMRSYLQLQNAAKTQRYNTNLLGLRNDIKALILDFSTLQNIKYKKVESDVFTHSLYNKKKRKTSDFSAWTSIRMKELNAGESSRFSVISY
jgi:hypothetical protein